ncbi:MAG: hypothetical protein QCI38_01645 [Candidatus Thermoplasmatota archaeon]|nr:hypothetical protein [Candidatus Thermoplasmatota archaeon]
MSYDQYGQQPPPHDGWEQPPPQQPQGYEQYPPQDPYAQPPPEYGMGPPPKKFPMMMVLIAIIAVVAILAVLFLFVLGGGQGSPDAAVNTMAAKLNSGDFAGVIDTTMLHFADQTTKNAAASNMQGMFPAGTSVRVVSTTTTNKDQLSAGERQSLEYMKTGYQTAYGITIEDYAKVSANLEMTYSGQTGTMPVTLYAFKVNGAWYIEFGADMGYNEYDDYDSDYDYW